MNAAPASFASAVARRLDAVRAARIPERIWARDATAWKDDPSTPEIGDRLGWLTVGRAMTGEVEALETFAARARGEFDRVVLCGMGGSSLAPEVLWQTFGAAAGYPTLTVLDSTDPRAVLAVTRTGDVARTLFIVSSKSGTTVESDSFLRHFWRVADERGAQFVAITDPLTVLDHLAMERGFRRAFRNPADIGGRFSALSLFGLVPAALIGADVGRILERANGMAAACERDAPDAPNPGAWLGAALAEAALAGRDKVTFVLSEGIASFGLWAEQLVAESTGKEGVGILPVAGEPLGPPEVYAADRVFVRMMLRGEPDADTDRGLEALAAAGHPVIRLLLDDPHDLGAEFFRWEFATAVAGAVLRINPFDQPNVAESKANTNAVLREGRAPTAAATRSDVTAFLGGVRPGDYLALLAYLPPTPEHDRRLAAIRVALRDRLRAATTVGYGPRYLHSTGQLHKGGPARGHFLQITDRPEEDLAVPDAGFTFGQLEAAQAEGDLQALRGRGRPSIRVEGLALLEG